MVANGTPRSPYRDSCAEYDLQIQFNNANRSLNSVVAQVNPGCPFRHVIVNGQEFPIVPGPNTVSKAALNAAGFSTLDDLHQWTLGL